MLKRVMSVYSVPLYLQMSKSKGNVVDPHSILSKYGVDPLRYFLLKEGSIQHDGGTSIASSFFFSFLCLFLFRLLRRASGCHDKCRPPQHPG